MNRKFWIVLSLIFLSNGSIEASAKESFIDFQNKNNAVQQQGKYNNKPWHYLPPYGEDKNAGSQTGASVGAAIRLSKSSRRRGCPVEIEDPEIIVIDNRILYSPKNFLDLPQKKIDNLKDSRMSVNEIWKAALMSNSDIRIIVRRKNRYPKSVEDSELIKVLDDTLNKIIENCNLYLNAQKKLKSAKSAVNDLVLMSQSPELEKEEKTRIDFVIKKENSDIQKLYRKEADSLKKLDFLLGGKPGRSKELLDKANNLLFTVQSGNLFSNYKRKGNKQGQYIVSDELKTLWRSALEKEKLKKFTDPLVDSSLIPQTALDKSFLSFSPGLVIPVNDEFSIVGTGYPKLVKNTKLKLPVQVAKETAELNRQIVECQKSCSLDSRNRYLLMSNFSLNLTSLNFLFYRYRSQLRRELSEGTNSLKLKALREKLEWVIGDSAVKDITLLIKANPY